MQNNGWIKLHRKLRENPIYKNSKAVHCWIECLLRANHNNESFYLGRKQIELKSGEFIFGREEFGKGLGISGSTIWFWLRRFEVDSMVDIKKTSKGCLCKIKNWEEFQTVDSNLDNKKTANKQQKNTDKNDKNDKKIKKYNIATNVAEGEIIPDILKDKQKHIQIIGIYAKAKKIYFENKEQQQSFIRRHVRPAKNLCGYDPNRIIITMKYLLDQADFKWTLESVGKFIDEDLTKTTMKKNNNLITSVI